MKASHTQHKFPRFRLILSCTLALLLLPVLAGKAAPDQPPAGQSAALVRIELRAPGDLQKVADAGQPILAQLTAQDGRAYLLMQAPPAFTASLRAAGLEVAALDANSQGAVYYLLTELRPGALSSASRLVRLLDQDGSQALARLDPAQVDTFAGLGLELARLQPHSLVLPEAAPPLDLPAAITPDPIIAGMMDQVNTFNVYDYDSGLSGNTAVTVGGLPYTIINRNTNGGSPIQHATQYVYEQFQSFGLDTSYHIWNTTNNPNVIGEIQGLSRPQDIFIITSHLDDMPNAQPPNYLAPGADDNASGSVGVLLAAQILSQYNWDCTLRFATFTGEEQGLLGSNAYANMVYNNGDNILGVLNLDMIAYNTISSSPVMELHTRPGNASDLAIANLFQDVISAYGINLTPQIVQDGISASDHYSFWSRGYPAILAIEDFEDFTPYYHTVNDTISTLDMTYFTNFVKASVGTFAHMGCLAPGMGSLEGTVSDEGGAPISDALVEAAISPQTGWQTTSGPDGAYALDLPEGTYQVTAQADGFRSKTITDVMIISGTLTNLDFTLEVTPTYAVSGYVTAGDSGQPISAAILVSGDTTTSTLTDPQTGYYTLTLQEGNYTLQAAAPDYLPESQPVSLFADRQLDFSLQPLSLLVVGDDGGMPYQSYYTAALDQLGVSYRLVSSLPDLETVGIYQGVIWFTGDAVTGTLTGSDQAILGAYLDGGGALFLSGQNIGADIGDSDFYQDYLHARFMNDTSAETRLTGLDFLSGTADIFISGSGGADNQTSPDEIAPASGGVAVYEYMGLPDYGGVAYPGVLYRSVYFSFGFEAINRSIDRLNVMDAVLDYLNLPHIPQAPQADYAFVETTLPWAVQFTNLSQGSPLRSYAWNFGDGALSDMTHPLHTFPGPGAYTVVMTATSRYGQDSITHTVMLEPASSYVISGTVMEKDTGLPLAASIEVVGLPGAPVQTDPATGSFSLTLPGGDYTLLVQSAGHFSQTVIISLTSDMQLVIDLAPIRKIALPLLLK